MASIFTVLKECGHTWHRVQWKFSNGRVLCHVFIRPVKPADHIVLKLSTGD